MDNKDKIIREMAQIICDNDCEECAKESADFYGQTIEEAKNNHCLLKNCAKKLINAGYRKLDDHAIMVLRKAKGLEERIRKETAKEILQWLIEHTFESCIFETYFKEQYGVEIKE